ncbi:solute carrier family 22 member 7-like [Littorina saxatilis]|uniref:solute carrier family 22 member 7-like n=1 Tax=Littorina saxatilis TaxID=31220 RepID=UPI0038B49AA3
MREKGNIDPTLRALGGRARYQMLHLFAINIGAFGASYQLLNNIFTGREVLGQRCAAPDNSSLRANNDFQNGDSNSSHVTYGLCEITVSKGNLSSDEQQYPCPDGYEYGYSRDLSFRTEFDLVCDRKLLGGLTQSFVIMGQGFGAVLSAIVSDRFGRKRTLIASQLGLLSVGIAIGLAPSYAVLAAFKFLVGGFQQGVVTGMAIMSIELLPTEYRSLSALVGSVLWGCSSCSMAVYAYLLRDFPWRYLQYTLSGVSALICLLQLWYLDESLRWLVANGRKDGTEAVLKRAARVNGKDLAVIVSTLQDSVNESQHTHRGSCWYQRTV